MSVLTSNVIGLDVFSVKEGKKIDDIKDIIYDPTSQRVLALIVDSGGIFSEGKAIAIHDIKSIGSDAVVIESEDLIKKNSELSEMARHIAGDDTHLTKSRVVSESGSELGSISDLAFDPQTGEVKELIVTQGGLRDIQTGRKKIKPSEITTVGEDAIIVKSFTESEFDEQSQNAGVTGVINQAKSSIKTAWENAEQNLEHMKDKWDEPDTKERIEQAKTDMLKNARESQNQLQQKAQQAKSAFDQAKNDPENQRKMSNLKDQAANQLHDVKQGVRHKNEQHKQDLQAEALGQYITRNVIDKNNQFIARRGEIVTQTMLDQAKRAGLIDNVIKNLSKEPVVEPAGALGGEVEVQINPDNEPDSPKDPIDSQKQP